MSRLLSSPSAIRVSMNDDKEPLNTNYLSFAGRDCDSSGARKCHQLYGGQQWTALCLVRAVHGISGQVY